MGFPNHAAKSPRSFSIPKHSTLCANFFFEQESQPSILLAKMSPLPALPSTIPNKDQAFVIFAALASACNRPQNNDTVIVDRSPEIVLHPSAGDTGCPEALFNEPISQTLCTNGGLTVHFYISGLTSHSSMGNQSLSDLAIDPREVDLDEVVSLCWTFPRRTSRSEQI